MHRATKSTQDGPDSAALSTTPQSAKPMGGTAAKRATDEPSSMSDTNADDSRTTSQLVRAAVDAGASGLFAAAVAEDRHGMPAEKVAYAVEHGRDVERHCRGGHFMTALWDGEESTAYAHADRANQDLLASMGVGLADATGVSQ